MTSHPVGHNPPRLCKHASLMSPDCTNGKLQCNVCTCIPEDGTPLLQCAHGVLSRMLPGDHSATVLVPYAALAAAQNFVESADTTECTLGTFSYCQPCKVRSNSATHEFLGWLQVTTPSVVMPTSPCQISRILIQSMCSGVWAFIEFHPSAIL